MKYIVLFFCAILVGFDQLFKNLAIKHLLELPGNTLPLIDDFLHLTYVENRGAAFSLLSGSGTFLIVISAIVVVVMLFVLLSKKVTSKLLCCTLGLIIAGGLGNLIDRIFRGFVVDYIDLRVINFAVFNFADCCVVIGTIILMAYIIFVDFAGSRKRAKLASPPHKKLKIQIEDHTNDKSPKVNKYVNVVGEVISEPKRMPTPTGNNEQDDDI